MPERDTRATTTRIARVFRNGRNQAVRIPVEMSFETDEVVIEQRDDGLLLRPHARAGWDDFFADAKLRLPDAFEAPEDVAAQERR